MIARALRFAGVEPLIEQADNDEAGFAAIADDMIARRVDVLMTTPLSRAGGVAVEAKAKAAGIPVVNCDRISLGGHADLVTRENVRQVAVSENAIKAADLCAGDVAAACAEVGILVG
ncbi:substrate-binding domain-containing protein [Actinosynnema sp. CA-299493]